MKTRIFMGVLMAGMLVSQQALAWRHGRHGGYWGVDQGWHGEHWGGRGAWHGGYGWQGGGYYVPPYGWSAGHGGACWRWWYGQWVWSC